MGKNACLLFSSYYCGQSNWFCHCNASLSCSHKPWFSITVTNIEIRPGSGLASAPNQLSSKGIQLVRHASNPNCCHAQKIQSSTSSIQIQSNNRPNTSVPEVLTVPAARSSLPASLTLFNIVRLEGVEARIGSRKGRTRKNMRSRWKEVCS